MSRSVFVLEISSNFFRCWVLRGENTRALQLLPQSERKELACVNLPASIWDTIVSMLICTPIELSLKPTDPNVMNATLVWHLKTELAFVNSVTYLCMWRYHFRFRLIFNKQELFIFSFQFDLTERSFYNLHFIVQAQFDTYSLTHTLLNLPPPFTLLVCK